MATAAVLAPHDVPTILNYYTPIGTEEPYQYVLDPPEGKAPNNLGSEPHEVVVQDARGRENEFSLDQNGFQFVNWPSKEKDFDDEERIKAVYYPEVEEILRTVAGAKKVFIFDHTIRYVLCCMLLWVRVLIDDPLQAQARGEREAWTDEPRPCRESTFSCASTFQSADSDKRSACTSTRRTRRASSG